MISNKVSVLQPTWKNEPTVDDLRTDLKAALESHTNQVTKISTWLDNLNVTGSAKINNGIGRSSITPKMIRKHAEWRYASLSEPLHTADSLFSTKPRTGEDRAISEQAGTLLKHQFDNEIDKTRLIDDAVRTNVDQGTIIYRVGWDLQTEKHKVTKAVEKDNQVIGTIQVEEEITVVSRPTVEVVPYASFIIDPNARGDTRKANFAIYKFPTNISKLKAQGYENLDLLDVESLPQEDADANPDKAYNDYIQYSDKARKEFTAYEYWGYWDINGDETLVPIVATFVDQVMIKLKENPFPDKKIPFVITHYLPVVGSNYGEPDGLLIEDNQKINGALTRGMLDTAGRSANGQKGKMEQALDAANMLKYERGEDYTYRQGIDPSKAFYDHTYPELSSTAYNLLQMNAAEAESMTGVKTYGDGITGTSLGENGGLGNAVLNAAAKRESGILRRIAAGLAEVASKVMSMNEVFLTPEEVERITGKPYVAPRPGLVTTDVKVKIRTAEEDAKLAETYAFISQTSEDAELRQLVMAEIAKLKNTPDLAAKIEAYQPTPDPLAEQLQLLEMELLKAKIANEKGKAHNNMSSGILDTAKAQTETAKYQNILADTDNKKLEYVEEETGTNHERAKDLLKTQAQGNIHYKAFEKQIDSIDGESK